MSYTPLLRRIREDKTNYRKRKAILIGKHNFAAVRISNENLHVQILKHDKKGDEVLASAHSRELVKHGWKGSRKSIPACYLTGLLAGAKAVAKNVKNCILYAGNRAYSPRIAAAVKGLIDAGLSIPVQEDILPSEDRLSGQHIAQYAQSLKEKNSQLYSSRFSGLIKEGFSPEAYPENVEKVKTSVLGRPSEPKAKVESKEKPEKKKPTGEKVKKPKGDQKKAKSNKGDKD